VPCPTFKVAAPEEAPPVKPLPAVTPVISPAALFSFLWSFNNQLVPS
jgi:hypothetical protein